MSPSGCWNTKPLSQSTRELYFSCHGSLVSLYCTILKRTSRGFQSSLRMHHVMKWLSRGSSSARYCYLSHWRVGETTVYDPESQKWHPSLPNHLTNFTSVPCAKFLMSGFPWAKASCWMHLKLSHCRSNQERARRDLCRIFVIYEQIGLLFWLQGLPILTQLRADGSEICISGSPRSPSLDAKELFGKARSSSRERSARGIFGSDWLALVVVIRGKDQLQEWALILWSMQGKLNFLYVSQFLSRLPR